MEIKAHTFKVEYYLGTELHVEHVISFSKEDAEKAIKSNRDGASIKSIEPID